MPFDSYPILLYFLGCCYMHGRRSVGDGGGDASPTFQRGGQHRNCPPTFQLRKNIQNLLCIFEMQWKFRKKENKFRESFLKNNIRDRHVKIIMILCFGISSLVNSIIECYCLLNISPISYSAAAECLIA